MKPFKNVAAIIKDLIVDRRVVQQEIDQAKRAEISAQELQRFKTNQEKEITESLRQNIEIVGRRFLKNRKLQLKDFNVRENHHGRNHIVFHVDSPFIDNESVNIPLEVLDWTEEEWARHESNGETLDPNQVRLERLRMEVDSKELALERAKSNYEAAKSALNK